MQVYLVDKSAYGQRLRSSNARVILESLANENGLASCEIVALEVLYSARNAKDYELLRRDLLSLVWLETCNNALRRALDVQRCLSRLEQHRLSLPDLIVAATAEQYGAVVLHYDKDYDIISNVTGQSTRWIESPTAHF